jgi:protein-tyrosine phosphatase
MADDGVRAVAVTPHVREDWPTTPAQMEQGLAAVRGAVAAAGVPIDVLPGGEIALEELRRLDDDALTRFGLGGNPRLLLLEFPYYGWPLGLARTLSDLRSRGIVAVIAHPERSPDVAAAPDALGELVEAGGVVQLTAASVDGRLGRRMAQCSRTLLELVLAHLFASDAHAPWLRGAGMSAARDAVGGPLGVWLTEDVPAALLAGTPLPPRPALAGRRRGHFRR